MLKSEIIEKLQTKHSNLNTYDIELIIKIFFKKIISSLNDGNTIEIRGFGTFKKKINREKQVRNPKIMRYFLRNKLINFILKQVRHSTRN